MQTKMMLRYCENTLRFSRVGANKKSSTWKSIVAEYCSLERL